RSTASAPFCGSSCEHTDQRQSGSLQGRRTRTAGYARPREGDRESETAAGRRAPRELAALPVGNYESIAQAAENARLTTAGRPDFLAALRPGRRERAAGLLRELHVI